MRDARPFAALAVLILAGSTLGVQAHAADQSKTPPLGPEGDLPITGEAPAGVKTCLQILGITTGPLNQHMVRFLLSHSAEWGPIFRADVMADDGVATRFVCVIDTKKLAPAVFAVEPGIDPLREGPWGAPKSTSASTAQNSQK